MTKLQEYIDYLKRTRRTDGRTLRQLNELKLNRLIGISYGASEKEMDHVKWEEVE